jgi:hypothetical protein
MYSRYSEVSLKNGMWRKIWIRDIEGILMIFKSDIPKNEAKEEFPIIEPLTSCFLLSDLDLDFFAQKIQFKVHKHCKWYTVLMHTAISYYSPNI